MGVCSTKIQPSNLPAAQAPDTSGRNTASRSPARDLSAWWMITIDYLRRQSSAGGLRDFRPETEYRALAVDSREGVS